MNDALDKALSEPLLEPPADFVEQVMARVSSEHAAALLATPDAGGGTRAIAPPARRFEVRGLLEWLALTGAVVAGSTQIAGLLFGIFAFTTAG